MSDFIIRDGSGTGYRAKVSSSMRLQTSAVMEPKIHAVSEDNGQAYLFGTGLLTIPATEAAVLYIKNVDPDRRLIIADLGLSWNGGTVNRNRVLSGRMYVGMAAPSANATVLTVSSSNLGFNIQALLDARKWNGVGAGMTVASNGVLSAEVNFGAGYTTAPFNGSVILPPNYVLGFTMQGEEAGVAGALFSAWMKTGSDE